MAKIKKPKNKTKNASKKATKKAKKKAPSAKSARRTKAPKKATRRRSGHFGGNTVDLGYDDDSSSFVAITQEDASTASITWTVMGVQLRDPDGNLAGDMVQDPEDPNKWTLYVPNPQDGDWTAIADFEGSDQETTTFPVSN